MFFSFFQNQWSLFKNWLIVAGKNKLSLSFWICLSYERKQLWEIVGNDRAENVHLYECISCWAHLTWQMANKLKMREKACPRRPCPGTLGLEQPSLKTVKSPSLVGPSLVRSSKGRTSLGRPSLVRSSKGRTSLKPSLGRPSLKRPNQGRV